jgi:hypothetical protein
MIRSPWLFLNANSSHAEHSPAQQRPQSRDNDSRPKGENETDQQGSCGATEKECDECVGSSTMSDFGIQAASDPQGKCRDDRKCRQFHATFRNRTSVSM